MMSIDGPVLRGGRRRDRVFPFGDECHRQTATTKIGWARSHRKWTRKTASSSCSAPASGKRRERRRNLATHFVASDLTGSPESLSSRGASNLTSLFELGPPKLLKSKCGPSL